MRDEESPEPKEEARGWHSDPETLLLELQRSRTHWGNVPKIPGYDDLIEMRRGGQGIVYRGRQISTGRDVAVKVLLDGIFASESSRIRFHREIDVVARLCHPAIVPVYDCGVMADGRPYYVMAYVDGVPIDDARFTSTRNMRRTLGLFARVCDAVECAHQHGVIHRDLKPSNILVDSSSNPHILDFGLAKTVAVDEPRSASSVSQTGQFLGSLAWASPEQIEETDDEVGIRSDVYALGVILYQLLTGRVPHPVTRNLRQTMNAILTEDPPRPRSLRRNIPCDLETIVLRCLAKEPSRRYPSVGELATDIRRYLSGEPIEAKRDHTWYVMGKTIARHKGVSSLLAILLLLLVGVAITMTVLYNRTHEAEHRALANLEEVTIEARKSEEVRVFLERVLTSFDPFASSERTPTVREALDFASNQIEGRFVDYPEVEADVRTVMANCYYSLGRLDEAERHYQRALDLRREYLGETHVDFGRSLRDIAIVRTDQRRLEDAEKLLQQALEITVATVGKNHVFTADCLLSLAELRQAQLRMDEANELYRQAIASYRDTASDDDERMLTALVQWSGLLISIWRIDGAEEKLEEALSIIRANPTKDSAFLGGTLLYLALAKINRGNSQAARSLLEKAIQEQIVSFGEEHPRTAEMYNTMAKTYRAEGRHKEAEMWFRKALDVCEKVSGRESADAAHSLWGIARALFDQGKIDGAIELYREAVEVRRKAYEPGHHLIGASILAFGLILEQLGRYEEALPYLKEIADAPPRASNGEPALSLSPSLGRALVSCLEHLGRHDEAAKYRARFAEKGTEAPEGPGLEGGNQ